MKAILIHTAKKILPWVVGIALLYWVLTALNWLPRPGDWLISKPLVIDDTELIVHQIKQIAELRTASLYAEVVVDSSSVSQAKVVARGIEQSMYMPVRPTTSAVGKRLVLIVKGTVVAGINMQALAPEHIVVSGDSISLQLPPVQVLEVVVNPTGMEVFAETGTWDNKAREAVKAKATGMLVQKARELHLLATARQNTMEAMTAFLRTAGFTRIHLEVP